MVTLLTCNCLVHGLNLGWNMNYPEWQFLLFPQFLLANLWIALLIISQKLPFTTYPVHYLLLSSHFALFSLHYWHHGYKICTQMNIIPVHRLCNHGSQANLYQQNSPKCKIIQWHEPVQDIPPTLGCKTPRTGLHVPYLASPLPSLAVTLHEPATIE